MIVLSELDRDPSFENQNQMQLPMFKDDRTESHHIEFHGIPLLRTQISTLRKTSRKTFAIDVPLFHATSPVRADKDQYHQELNMIQDQTLLKEMRRVRHVIVWAVSLTEESHTTFWWERDSSSRELKRFTKFFKRTRMCSQMWNHVLLVVGYMTNTIRDGWCDVPWRSRTLLFDILPPFPLYIPFWSDRSSSLPMEESGLAPYRYFFDGHCNRSIKLKSTLWLSECQILGTRIGESVRVVEFVC